MLSFCPFPSRRRPMLVRESCLPTSLSEEKKKKGKKKTLFPQDN
jgi:hypothetical protein